MEVALWYQVKSVVPGGGLNTSLAAELKSRTWKSLGSGWELSSAFRQRGLSRIDSAAAALGFFFSFTLGHCGYDGRASYHGDERESYEKIVHWGSPSKGISVKVVPLKVVEPIQLQGNHLSSAIRNQVGITNLHRIPEKSTEKCRKYEGSRLPKVDRGSPKSGTKKAQGTALEANGYLGHLIWRLLKGATSRQVTTTGPPRRLLSYFPS